MVPTRDGIYLAIAITEIPTVTTEVQPCCLYIRGAHIRCYYFREARVCS
jgi:hypothetical protein